MSTQIETLLENPVSQLEALSVLDLTARLQHYFIITRPDLAKKQPFKLTPGGQTYEQKMKLERAKQLAKQAGINLGF